MQGDVNVVQRRLESMFEEAFGPTHGRRLLLVRSPGRTEIAGNHTDHEGGDVIAGAVTRYVWGLFSPATGDEINLESEGYGRTTVGLDALAPVEAERTSTASLVRGMAAQFKERGAEPAAFDAVVVSEVPSGSGLSSSAAFELLLGCAMDELWADGTVAADELAIMAQRAEREWFGKPCGLMDQAAVALGGINAMSFAQEGVLAARRLDFDFADAGYAIVIVDVGADHAANTDDYAAVPQEMQAVAAELGANVLGKVSEEDLRAALPRLREKLGDRAVLRALHYYREQRLVARRAEALSRADMGAFLESTRRSGASSAMYLQNVSIGGASEQPSMLAIAYAEELLQDEGAVRVHGGGFGGTIQAFVPLGAVEGFCRSMDAVFGEGASSVCAIDQEGACATWL